MIDGGEPSLTNTADARFTLTTPDAALLVTQAGTVLQIVRHQGPKFLAPCD